MINKGVHPFCGYGNEIHFTTLKFYIVVAKYEYSKKRTF